MTSISDIKEHVLNRIVTKDINSYPFYNLYVEDIFPIEFYQLLKDKMLYYKYNEDLQDRNWDNPNFMNKRFLLRNIDDDEIDKIRQVFGDDEIKNALMKKFYYGSYLDEIVFNHDLQFVFTDGNRFQKIHTDIPAQFISVNFYIPEDELTEQEETTKTAPPTDFQPEVLLSVLQNLATIVSDNRTASDVSEPPKFSGRTEDWDTWYQQFRTYLKAKGWLDTFLHPTGPGTPGFNQDVK